MNYERPSTHKLISRNVAIVLIEAVEQRCCKANAAGVSSKILLGPKSLVEVVVVRVEFKPLHLVGVVEEAELMKVRFPLRKLLGVIGE